MNDSVYKWKFTDTIIIDLLFIISFLGIIYFLFLKSLLFLLIFLSLYIIMNILLSLICVDCVYSGKFCPGISQLLFGSLLSRLYKKRPMQIGTLKVILILYGIFGFGTFGYAFTILVIYFIQEYTIVIVSLILCFFSYSIIAWSILCPKCSNNKICPVKNIKSIFRRI